MTQLHRAVVSALLACAFAGCSGPKGPVGDVGPPAPTTGTLAGTITDGVAGDPLPAVTVTASDSGGATLAVAATAADGTFGMTVPSGSMRLSFAKTYYTSPGELEVGVGIGRTVNLAVTLNEAASGRPSVTLAAAGDDVGYATTVALTAIASDPNGDDLAYAWGNVTAPLLGTVSGTGPGGSITMPTLPQAFAFRPVPSNPGQYVSGYTLEDRFGVIPILGDTRGQVTAQVTVSDGRGQAASASLTVSAASAATGVRNVAVGTRVYLNSGHDASSAWVLTPPGGSVAVLDGPASRTPSFVADVAGTYTVQEGAHTMDVEAGTWNGIADGGSTVDPTCTGCHDGVFAGDEFSPWKGTRHATVLSRGIDGSGSFGYAAACLECHSVGFDAGAANGGFDDVASAAGWTFPSSLAPGNWASMLSSAPSVARLANVQCESCHGPQTSAVHTQSRVGLDERWFESPRISYAAEACAGCHGRGAYHVYSEWATPSLPDDTGAVRGHSNRIDALVGVSGSGAIKSCARCHTAQGYVVFAAELLGGRVTINQVDATLLAGLTPSNVEPVTCVACHDPHDATNPSQLRFYGDTPNLPAGFAGYGMGKGALCLTCHNSRNGAQTGSDTATYLHEDGEPYNAGNPTGYSSPHVGFQGDVFEGRNAYFLAARLPMTSKHAAVQDTCVGCHMTLQPKGYVKDGMPRASGHLFRITDEDLPALCASCHGPNVDGAGIQGQVAAQLAALEAKLGLAAKTKLNMMAGGIVRVRAYDPATDFYSSTSASNVVLDVVANPIVSVGIEKRYGANAGQVQLILTLTNPVSIPFVDGTGAPAPTRSLATFEVQLGALKDGASAVVYALSGNFIRAAWNDLLIAGDRSLGLHNPTFVTAVLDASMAKDVSN